MGRRKFPPQTHDAMNHRLQKNSSFSSLFRLPRFTAFEPSETASSAFQYQTDWRKRQARPRAGSEMVREMNVAILAIRSSEVRGRGPLSERELPYEET